MTARCFTDLPAELRNQIYFEALVPSECDWTMPTITITQDTGMALRQVSRSVRAEAMGICISENPLHCRVVNPAHWGSTPPTRELPFDKWLRVWGQLVIPSIRHLILRRHGTDVAIEADFRNPETSFVRMTCLKSSPMVLRHSDYRLLECGWRRRELENFVLAFLLPEGELKMTPKRFESLYKTYGQVFSVMRTGGEERELSHLLSNEKSQRTRRTSKQ